MGIVVPRALEGRIRPHMRRRGIIGIRGPRQAGKTTLMKVIEGRVRGETAFVNLDLQENRKVLEERPLDLVARHQRKGKRLTLFLDEIQRVAGAGEQLKILFDESSGVKLVVSGSSSLELKAKVLPPLVGRLLLFELLTFDFGEYLLSKDPQLHRLYQQKNRRLRAFLNGGGEPEPPSFQQEFLKHWKEYAIYGGYPEVVKAPLSQKETILKSIFNLYLDKDISALFAIEDTLTFERFLSYMATVVSHPFSLSSVAASVGVSYPIAKKFLNILQHTYLLRLLRPYHRNLVTELQKSPKAYFLDLGMRNSALGSFAPFDSRADRGALLENAVFRQLASWEQGEGMRFWRTAAKAEVDFVLKGEEVTPVEVKTSGSTPGRSFLSFLSTYTPSRAVIATLDTFRKERRGKTLIYWVPVYMF